MALASIFTGWNQTGSTLSETAGDPGRYGRVPYADMLASTSSVRIFAGAGAPALILFNHNPSLDFEHFFLQPMDGPLVDENTRLAVAYCLAHPRWRLSVQTHKALGIR